MNPLTYVRDFESWMTSSIYKPVRCGPLSYNAAMQQTTFEAFVELSGIIFTFLALHLFRGFQYVFFAVACVVDVLWRPWFYSTLAASWLRQEWQKALRWHRHRPQRTTLFRRLDEARTHEEWLNAASALDRVYGTERWYVRAVAASHRLLSEPILFLSLLIHSLRWNVLIAGPPFSAIFDLGALIE